MNDAGNCVVKVSVEEDTQTEMTGQGKDGVASSNGSNGRAGGAPVSAGNSKKPVCRDQGKVVIPCVKDGAWWSASNACYVAAVDPPPAKSDPVWEGNEGGAIYSCAGPVGGGGSVSDLAGDVRVVGPQGLFWSATPPGGGPPSAANLPNARTLADQAIARMRMRAPKIGIAPDDAPGSVGLVGMPVWMWVEDAGKRTMGPVTATASSGGHSVTATASVTELTWDMGDGTSVTCTGKGTKYDVSFGITDSPDCGHRYTQAGEYDVTVTASWEVQWSGLGQSGTIPMELERSTTIRVGEAQAVVTSTG
ncbi:PKD domain-containing protein [Janibacter anophelis]|uniref:PKD domain-containing protein n=1 Tax=Janibacter anophelis TaxID=319054 RepID=UPI0039F13D1A